MKQLSPAYRRYINSKGWEQSRRRRIALHLLFGQDVIFPLLKAQDVEHLNYKRVNFKNCRGYEIPFLDLLPLNRFTHRKLITPIKDLLRWLRLAEGSAVRTKTGKCDRGKFLARMPAILVCSRAQSDSVFRLTARLRAMPVTAEVFRVSPTPRPAIDISFNDLIDFCIWILEYDQLQVAPFDQHPQASGPLQHQGLTPQLWQIWFERVVRSQHPLLTWEGWNTSRSEWVEDRILIDRGMAERLQQSPEWDDSPIDWEANRAAWGHQYDLYQAQAQAAAEEAQTSPLNWDLLPIDLFPMPEAHELKRSLAALWEQYDETEVLPRLMQHGYPERMLNCQIRSAFSAQLPLPQLNFYLVTYPVPIQVTVSSCSIVASTLPEPESEDFKSFVLDAVATLPEARFLP